MNARYATRTTILALCITTGATPAAHERTDTDGMARHTFEFPDVHPQANLEITLHRTLRVPDDGRSYPLPPSLGPFPAQRVRPENSGYPADIAIRRIPMYQSEAMWIGFGPTPWPSYPMRVRVLTGATDAISGETVKVTPRQHPADTFPTEPQGFVIVPEQPWLDGFKTGSGEVRQFVAEPLGLGRSAEEQLAPEATPQGGLWIGVEPIKGSIWEKEKPKTITRGAEMQALAAPSQTEQSMGLAPGGTIVQQIIRSKRPESHWSGTVQWIRFELMSTLAWMHATGRKPPHPGPTSEAYTHAGLPWFDYWDAEREALEGSNPLSALESLEEWDHTATQPVDIPSEQVHDLSPKKTPTAIVP